MYSFFKKFFFRIPPEEAHFKTMRLMKMLSRLQLLKIFSPSGDNPILFLGLRFRNPVGLAAGFDKNAEYLSTLEDLGFGFVEIGTVTPLPQDGNPQPRLFRLPNDEALLNRMGFNNLGADKVAQNLQKYQNRKLIIGGNIGKNKATPNENAHLDYEICFQKLYSFVDYFVINVSSPNTPNLRDLQEKEALMRIVNTLEKYRKTQNIRKPLLLKIAPDLTENALDDVLFVFENTALDGLIVSNTTIDYSVLKEDKNVAEIIAANGGGGISGAPVFEKSNEVLRYISSKNPKIPTIGVGGIDSVAAAEVKYSLGCQLIQVYTGFIYKGPKLIWDLAKL